MAGIGGSGLVKPVHPMLVHFPIALLVFSVAADLTGFFADIASLRSAGWWALLAAALGGTATVAAGVFDMRRAVLAEGVHERVHRHMRVGLTLLAAIVGLTIWRWRIQSSPVGTLPVFYLGFAVLTVALAAFQGWLGGELVYADGVSVKQEKNRVPVTGRKPDPPAHH